MKAYSLGTPPMNPAKIWLFLLEIEALPQSQLYKPGKSPHMGAQAIVKAETKEEAKTLLMQYCVERHIVTVMARGSANGADQDLSDPNTASLLRLADQYGVVLQPTDGLPLPPNN